MVQILLVAFGGAIGSLLRYYVGILGLRLLGASFPWGTLTVNLVGSFVIGLFAEMIARKFGGSVELRLLLMTGLLGGFTTFSSFSLDTVLLIESGAVGTALLYVFISVGVSLGMVLAGLSVARAAF